MVEKLPPTPEQEADAFMGGSFKDGEPYTGDMTEDEKRVQAEEAKAQAAADKAARAQEKARAKAESGEDDGEDDGDDQDDDDTDGEDDGEGDGEDEDSEDDGEDEDEESKPKGKRSPQARINKAVRKQRDAERRAEFAESQLSQMNARLAALESGKPLTDGNAAATTAATDDLKEPKASDFEYGELDERYRDAMVDYRVKKALREERATQAQSVNQQAAQREAQEMLGLAATFEDAGIDEFDDFEDVVIDGARRGKWPLPEAVGKLMLKSEVGHRIAYHLATHPKEARRIAQQDPLSQAATFGRLEAKFAPNKTGAQQQGGKKPAANTSKAPPPPQKRAKGGKGKATVSAATTDFEAFERMASRHMG